MTTITSSLPWSFWGGERHIAYTRDNDTDDNQQVYVKKYQADNWVTVGTGPVSAFSAADHFDSGNPRLAVADGVLYVAFEESTGGYPEIFVRRKQITPWH